MSPELLLVALLVTKVWILLETSQCWSIIIILGFLFYFRISAVCQFLGAAQETLDLSDHEYEVDDIQGKHRTEEIRTFILLSEDSREGLVREAKNQMSNCG